MLSTGATPATAQSHLIASNFATNQTSLSFNFPQTKNAELFGLPSGERYYSLLFNIKNQGAENSVLATVYHLPANIDFISVEDYFSSQTSGVLNNVLTTWNYVGDGVLTGFDVTGKTNSFITGLTSGLTQVLNWSYNPTGDVSGFAITGYINSGDFYSVYSGGNLVPSSEYEIKFTPTPQVNFYSLPNLFALNIVESTGNTGFLSTNYRAFIDGFEELSGDYSIDGNNDQLIFNVPPASGSTIVIQELTGVTQLLNAPLSGQINFTVNFDADAVENYITKGIDVYTGANTGTPYSLSGFALLKTVNFLENASSQSFSIFANEVPNNQFVYYKFVGQDDFGTGYVYGAETSGYLFSPPEQLFYTNGIPPTLSFDRRTGNFFSGYNSPANVPNSDGALIYQTGSSGQNLYLVKSGQWKTILPYEEITGNIDQTYLKKSDGLYISGRAITGYNQSITGLQFSGTTTKTLFLYPRNGQTISGSFTDNASIGDVVYATGNQTISGEKTFIGKLITETGFFGKNNSFGSYVQNYYPTIAGGSGNSGNSRYGLIGGGQGNVLNTGSHNTIAGGWNNKTDDGSWQSILGGVGNITSGSFTTIGGGQDNLASNSYASVLGGYYNTSSGYSASCLGGENNSAGGLCSVILAGIGCSTTPNAAYSIAGGYYSKADRYGSRAYSSDKFSADGDCQNIQFVLNATTYDSGVSVLSMDGAGLYFNILENQTDKIMMLTVKVLGVDEDANLSQYSENKYCFRNSHRKYISYPHG